MGRASRAKRQRRQYRDAGEDLRTAINRTAAGLDDTVTSLRALLHRLPFLQVIGNVIAVASVEHSRGDESLPIPLTLEYVTWQYLSDEGEVELDGRPIAGDDWPELLRLLRLVMVQSNLAKMTRLHREADVDRAGLRLWAQMHDLYIRQTSYWQHLSDQGDALFEPFADDLRRAGLVPFGVAAAILGGVKALIERHLAEHHHRVDDVRDSWVPAINDPLAREALEPDTQDLIEKLGADVPSMIGLWSIFGMAYCYVLGAAAIADEAGVSPGDVADFMSVFSLGFGQPQVLGGRPGYYEALRASPFVQLPDGQFLAHLAPYLQWTIRERYDEVLSSDPATGQAYRDHRATYLETEALRLLASTSPHAVPIGPAFYWFDDGEGRKRYEVDGLVFIDSILFVLEAKAGRISPRGRRGADLPELRRLVGEGQRQAARVERYIRRTKPAVFEMPDGRDLSILADERARVILVNPTIEPLHAFVTRWDELEKVGVATAKPWIWSVSVTDLRAIVETVESAGQLVHFLQRRQDLEGLNVLAAEELDLFGHYLDRGLYLAEVRRDRPDMASIGSWTEGLDAHFEGGAPPPRMALPEPIRELINALATLGPPGWIEATRLVLEGSSEAMENLAETVLTRRERVLSGAVTESMGRFLMGEELLAYMASEELDHVKLATYVAATRRYHRAKRAIGIGQVAADPSSVLVYIEDGELAVDPDADQLARDFVAAMSSIPMAISPAAPPPGRPSRQERRAAERLRRRGPGSRA